MRFLNLFFKLLVCSGFLSKFFIIFFFNIFNMQVYAKTITCCSEQSAQEIAEDVYYDRDPEFQTLIWRKDKQCHRKILNHLMKKLDGTRVLEQCYNEEIRGCIRARQGKDSYGSGIAGPTPEQRRKRREYLQSCREDEIANQCFKEFEMIQDFHKRIEPLLSLVYHSDLFNRIFYFSGCVGANEYVPRGEVPSLIDAIKSADEELHCSNLVPSSKGPQAKIVQSGGDLDRQYKLQRNSDGTYTIPLTVDFQADDNYTGSVPANEISQHFQQKVRNCLKQANQKMLGPNGEVLKISVSPPTEKTKCDAKTVTIHSESSLRFYNDKRYNANISCPKILRTMLYHVGLVDEHPYSKYPCRVISENSIMNKTLDRWNQVQNGEEESLLNPQQFQGILYGKCEKKNGPYNGCSKLAYKKRQDEKCSALKNYCSAGNIMGP